MHRRRPFRFLWACLLVLCAGCAFVPPSNRPTRLVTGETAASTTNAESLLLAAAEVFGLPPGASPQTVTLRLFSNSEDGAPETKRESLRMFVLGGLLLPGQLRIDRLTFSDQQITPEGVRMKADSTSTYVGIPPVCQSSEALLSVNDDRVVLSLENFYCNWAAIGNVIVKMDFQIEEIAPSRVSGRWSARVGGTANGRGSGYFTLAREPAAPDEAP